MKVSELIIKSGPARQGMSVADALNECEIHNLPGLPVCNAAGEIIGRLSVKHLLAEYCVPNDVSAYAHLLSGHQEIPYEKIATLMARTIDEAIQPSVPTIAADAPLFNALALMEEFDIGYLFVVEDGQYQGVITLLGVIQRLLDIYRGGKD